MIEQPGKKKMLIFSGSSNTELAQQVASNLGTELAEVERKSFASGEIYLRLADSVRGADCFVMQSHSGDINKTIMEQLLLVDALKRASAKRITAVLPFYPYSRQDKKALPREPISARLVGDMFVAAGVDRLVSIDLHTQQIQGFVDQPFDHLTAMPLFVNYFKEKFKEPISIISPDAGGVKRATTFAKHLEAYVGFVHKKRDPKIHNEVKSFTVIGEVEDRHAILLDDIIDTGGTIAAASRILKERGAKSVNVAATHGIFSDGSVEKLKDAPIDKIVVTDTLLQNGNSSSLGNVEVLSVSTIIANALTSIFTDDSVSALFMGENVL
ncbi:MAG: ribose-phosphate pyrophosphokinase [Actinobacteria bacterium]|jgi:ribose-phosphate pyrophosphokinase|nr:ribose-phosphate pyrophosphokinase [Actinomycetota bacterium]